MIQTPNVIPVPRLPDHIDSLPPEEQQKVKEQLRQIADDAAKRCHYTVEGKGALL